MSYHGWLVAATALAAFLSAAKTHGRQIRLERELQGYHEVDFGKTNPPFVEGLWRRDRIRFWTLTPTLGAVAAAIAFLGPTPASLATMVYAAVAILLWAPTIGFLTLGALSLRRLRATLRASSHDTSKAPGTDWLPRAGRGSVAWFGTSLVLLTASILTALV